MIGVPMSFREEGSREIPSSRSVVYKPITKVEQSGHVGTSITITNLSQSEHVVTSSLTTTTNLSPYVTVHAKIGLVCTW